MSKATNPDTMGSSGGGKKSHRCLTCCIICLVIVALFIAAIIGGSAIAFNKFVSPMIGGVKFGSAIKLMSGVYSGERNRKKILTDTYTEEDLSTFYDELNAHLFQKVRSTTELTAEYNALSAEEKAAVLTELSANKKWKNVYDGASDKEKTVLDYYVSANRYPLTIAKILSAVNIQGLTEQSENSTAAEQKEYVEAFLSTEPLARLAEAGDGEEGAGETGAGVAEQSADALQSLLSELHFDFTESGLLGQFDHTKDENYAANIKSVTFEITGNQIAALVGEVVSQVLSNVDLNKTMGTAEAGIDLSTVYLPDYVLIPQVIIEHKKDLPDNPTQADIDDYNKNTYVAVTLEMRFRALLNNKDLQDAVKNKLAELSPQAAKFTNVGFGVVKGILPKTLFVTMGIYPLDKDRDAYIKINNYSEKLQGELAKIINAAVGDTKLFGDETTGEETKEGEETPAVMNQLNQKVVSLFASLDEKGIPLSFVDIDRAEKRKTVGLRLAHVQMLLSMMQAYDPEGQEGITPYLFMTVLKCLFSNPEMTTPTEGDLDALYTEIQDKYGVEKAFWQEGGLLNMDNIAGITSAIDIKGINLRNNDQMKVNLQDKQLLSLFIRAKEDGTLDGFINGAEGNTAAGGEAEAPSDNVNDLISGLNMSKMEIKQKGETTVYTLSLRATLSISNLLGKALESEQAILHTFIDAIPQSLSFGITIYMHTDQAGNITYVGANEDGTDATGFLINAFDEQYSLKVITTLSTLMRCLGGGESSFDLDGIREKVDSAFQTVFDTLKDKLYCTIGVKDGTLILPSLYEIVQGFSKKKIADSETLTDADLLSTDQIKNVLATMYHSTYAPAQYTGTPGQAMLDDLQSKYYLAEAWQADDLFGDNVDIKSKMNADSILFRDVKDGEGHVIKQGLYRDTRTLAQLKVNVDGAALADLLSKSGKLNNLTDGNTDTIKGLDIVNCTYRIENGTTYADFIFRAKLIEETAAGGDAEEPAAGFSMDTLLPDDVYLTASILMYNDAGNYTAEARFSSDLVVNGNATVTEDLFKLIKVFSGATFDSAKITDQVSTSVSGAFETIEENVNFVYGNTPATAMQLENVFNTINKLSNKPTAEQKADPEFMATYVPYASNAEDDQDLCRLMREFGRDPASEDATVTLADAVHTQTVVKSVDVAAYAAVFGIDQAAKAPTSDDEAAFYHDLNANYYIADGKELTTEKVNAGDLVVDDTFISLAKLYQDTRAYAELSTYATDKRLAAIIDSMYKEGIEVKNGTETLGTAKILAVHISQQTLKTFVQVTMNPAGANAKLLPEVIYLTTTTWLVQPVDEHDQPLLDEHNAPRAKYYTTVSINNLDQADTENLFGRLNKLSASMSLDFSLKMSDMVAPVEENISDVFETKLSALGNIKYNEGNLEIPTLFAYLTDGKLEKNGTGDSVYNTAHYMVETDISGIADYYDTHTAATDPDKTDPETLMYRMRELGKAQYVADFADSMYIWVDGRPVNTGARYNANTFTEADEKDFYDQMQVYYFFAADKRPDKDWFQSGGGNIFNDLKNDFASTFNLTGYTDADITDNGLSLSADLVAYAKKGLYRYDGAQIGAKLSDKALASLIKSQNAITITSESIENVDVTSVELSYDQVEGVLTITITVKVEAKATSNALPSVFYMTTRTTRDALDNYETNLTINRFALSDGTTDGDLEKFLNNLSHVDSLNIKSQLDVDAICDSVTDALRDMLDTKLSAYVKAYGNYAADSNLGKGYIELNNIYHEIVTNLGVNRADYTTAGVDKSDEIMQSVICKLHDTDGKAYTSYNVKNGTEDVTNVGMTVHVTDRAFANKLVTGLTYTKGAYVQDVDSIFFVGAKDNDLFASWETTVSKATATDDFDITSAEAYILATVEVDMTQTGVSANVALLPDTLYLTLMVKYDDVQLNRSLVTSFVNDFDYDENRMVMSFIKDDADNLDFETAVMNIVNTYLPANCDFARNADADFTDYVGEASYTYMP